MDVHSAFTASGGRFFQFAAIIIIVLRKMAENSEHDKCGLITG